MKRKILFLALISAFLAINANAVMTVNIDRLNGYWAGNGGEFTLTPVTPIPGNPVAWQTFCLEETEYVNIPGYNYYMTIDPYAINGGGPLHGATINLPGGKTADPLDVRTAYLYTQFRNGTLSGKNTEI